MSLLVLRMPRELHAMVSFEPSRATSPEALALMVLMAWTGLMALMVLRSSQMEQMAQTVLPEPTVSLARLASPA